MGDHSSPTEEQSCHMVGLKKKLKKMVSMPSRWAVLHAGGGCDTLDVDRYEIMDRFGVHARDLRILDPLLSYPSAILGRGPRAIILSLEHIKAVITPTAVLLRDPTSSDVIPVAQELRRRLQHPTSPGDRAQAFELRALEVALDGVCGYLDARASELEGEAYPALDALTARESSRSLDRVRRLKVAMARLTARVRRVRDELERILDDDNDLADLCLQQQPHQSSDIIEVYTVETSSVADEVEMMLEAYFAQIDDTLGRLTALRKYTDATEEYVNIQVDDRRNRLIQVELFINAGSVCLAVYSLVAGIFGMSIHHPLNRNHGYMFKWVVIVTTVSCCFLYVAIMAVARRRGIVQS